MVVDAQWTHGNHACVSRYFNLLVHACHRVADRRAHIYVPIRMTAAATIAAFVLWRMQALVPSFAQNFTLGRWGLDILPAPLCVASVAAMVGLLLSNVLLWRGVIPRSFIDYEQEFIPARVIRVEMLKEFICCLFLARSPLDIGWDSLNKCKRAAKPPHLACMECARLDFWWAAQ